MTSRIFLSLFALALFALTLFACNRALAQRPLNLSATFLEQTWEWSDTLLGGKGPSSEDGAEYIRSGEAATRDLAKALTHIGDELGLDDYGRLLLLRDFLSPIPLGQETGFVPFSTARHQGWNQQSRAAFVTALLRAQGIAAAAFQGPHEILIGLPVSDTSLNGTKQYLEVKRNLLLVEQSVSQTYLLWDFHGRIGKPLIAADAPLHLLGDPGELFRLRALRSLAFGPYAVPESLRTQRLAKVFYLADGSAISYEVQPAVSQWLALAPEHHFDRQFLIERGEWAQTGMGAALTLLGQRYGEKELITLLLQSVQRHFTYIEGPLRSIHEILLSKEGDCDQLALILANMLADLGYSSRDMIAILWEEAGHLALGIRPRGAAPGIGAHFYEYQGAAYYVLDPTYYHRRGDELITQWGEMDITNQSQIHEIVYLEQNL